MEESDPFGGLLEFGDVVLDDDGDADLLVDAVAACAHLLGVGTGGQGAADRQAAFLVVDLLAPVTPGLRRVRAAAAHGRGCERGVVALRQAGDPGDPASLAGGMGGVTFARHRVGAVGLAPVGASGLHGLADEVRPVGRAEDIGQFHGGFFLAVRLVEIDLQFQTPCLLVVLMYAISGASTSTPRP